MPRIRKFDKRRFYGNKKNEGESAEPRPDSEKKTKPLSLSKKKILESKIKVIEDNSKGHSIVNLDLLQKVLFEACVCKVA